MGVIDSTTTIITCENCLIEEKQRIRDKGNAFKVNQWEQYSKWTHFECKIKDENTQNKEPLIIEAVCRNCGNSAEIKINA